MSEPVTVKLIDREFLIGCEPEERAGLIAAATYLDTKMRELRHAVKSPGFDRLAVLAAISITHELLDLRGRQDVADSTLAHDLGTLRKRLESSLADNA